MSLSPSPRRPFGPRFATGVARWAALASVAMLAATLASAQGPLPRPLSAVPTAAASPESFALTGRTPSAPRSRNPHGDIAIACEACHTADGWRPLRDDPDFEHARDTGFALEARHAQAACAGCHLGLRFTGLADLGGECQTCHVDVHRGALSDACQSCHEPTDWALVDGVEVHAQTAFPLTGSHLQVSCESCHTQGAGAAAFSPLPADCLGCHQDALQSTEASLVPHVASGFPSDCETCHTTVAWSAGPFDHAGVSGGFALVGAHMSLDCATCHTGPEGELPWTPASQDDCVSCHAADAQAAQPDHGGFPTTCTDCHGVNQWQGATVDHPQFPIFSGRHAGEWDTCQTCHTQPASFEVFTCLTCHEHRRSEMDDEHDEVRGYVYESTACYSCHPDGEDDLR